MEHQNDNSPEHRPLTVVQVTLTEGVDFLFRDESLTAIEQKLKELDIYKEDLLICGHAVPAELPIRAEMFKKTFFAIDFLEYRQKIKYADSVNIPIDLAYDSAEASGQRPVLSIYDPAAVDELGFRRYQVPNNISLQKALVAVITLDSIW